MTDTIIEAPAAPSEEPSVPLVARILRGAGWTFIWLGLLMVGFVIHQVYVTTWFAQQEQAELVEERLEHFVAVADEIRPVVVDADTGEPIADAVTGEPIEPDPFYTPPIPVDDPTGGTGIPSELPPPAPSDEPLIIIPEPDVRKGTAFASIRIPTIDRLKDGWTVVEGVELRRLRKGAGHMPWTPYPGQRGNSVISGHRTTWGAPFHELDELEPGDRIYIETAVGEHVYEVRDVRVVKPTALWVTNPRDGAWLTLTTCHPKFSARQRLIVFAEMVGGPNFETIHRLTG